MATPPKLQENLSQTYKGASSVGVGLKDMTFGAVGATWHSYTGLLAGTLKKLANHPNKTGAAVIFLASALYVPPVHDRVAPIFEDTIAAANTAICNLTQDCTGRDHIGETIENEGLAPQ